MKNRFFYVWILAAFALASCGGPKTQQQVELPAQLVETAPLAMSDISRELEFSTTLQGWQTLNVAPSLTGKIEHIYVEVGTTVGAGANLVRMDQNQYTTTKLTYTNGGVTVANGNYSGTLTKADANQTTDIEQKLRKTIQSNVNLEPGGGTPKGFYQEDIR